MSNITLNDFIKRDDYKDIIEKIFSIKQAMENKYLLENPDKLDVIEFYNQHHSTHFGELIQIDNPTIELIQKKYWVDQWVIKNDNDIFITQDYIIQDVIDNKDIDNAIYNQISHKIYQTKGEMTKQDIFNEKKYTSSGKSITREEVLKLIDNFFHVRYSPDDTDIRIFADYQFPMLSNYGCNTITRNFMDFAIKNNIPQDLIQEYSTSGVTDEYKDMREGTMHCSNNWSEFEHTLCRVGDFLVDLSARQMGLEWEHPFVIDFNDALQYWKVIIPEDFEHQEGDIKYVDNYLVEDTLYKLKEEMQSTDGELIKYGYEKWHTNRLPQNYEVIIPEWTPDIDKYFAKKFTMLSVKPSPSKKFF